MTNDSEKDCFLYSIQPAMSPSTPTPVLLSWSGGKDSALALQRLRGDPQYEVTGLLTAVTRGYDRISIHGVRRQLLDAQAASIGLPLHILHLEQSSSNEAYERAFHEALRSVAAAEAARHIAFGDLFLEDVRIYRERLLAGTDWRPLFPIWGEPTSALARRFIDDGFEAHLVCVDTTQLCGEFAGARFDHDFLDSLPGPVDPCGERGEFHTFVSSGPGFRRSVGHVVGERVLRDGRFMYCDLTA
jgi:uncharacterized protein (TIGR00290 family)